MRKRNKMKLLILALFFGIFSCKKNSTESSEITAPVKVKTAQVQQQDIREYLTFSGVTRYQKREDIKANVTGYISWMPFERGDHIRKGEAFATIRTKEQDALDEAAKIDSSLAKFSKPMRVYSNASGIISRLKVVPNDYVSEGDVLASISQPNTLVVQVSVPFEYSDKIKKGTPCTVLLPGHPPIDSEISSVLTSTDSVGQAQHYLVRLSEENLPENLNVQVKVVSKEAKNAKSIPHAALQTNELLTDFWVMKVVNDSLAVRKQVMPLIETDSLVQIESDEVQLNDRVITEGAYQMQDSTRVSIENE